MRKHPLGAWKAVLAAYAPFVRRPAADECEATIATFWRLVYVKESGHFSR